MSQQTNSTPRVAQGEDEPRVPIESVQLGNEQRGHYPSGQGKRIKIWLTVFPGPGATWVPKEPADGVRIAFSKVTPGARIEAGFFNAFTLTLLASAMAAHSWGR